MIADYRRYAKSLGIPQSEIGMRTDMFLEDLYKLMQERK